MASPLPPAAVLLLAVMGCSSTPTAPVGPAGDGGSDSSARDALVAPDGAADGVDTGGTAIDGATDDAAAAPVPITVSTRLGPVTGSSLNAVASFLGIPYAAPPVGVLRWRPPVDHAPWTAPLQTTAFGPVCPQTPGTVLGNPPMDEDCLTLNVWTPQPAASAHLPVMVYLHGGGFTSGTSEEAIFNGTTFAQHGVVLVTLNYRLGQLGFLAHPALIAEDATHHSAGNYGLLDQQAALRWVQTNITAFGGDPTKVTLFGESAGAMSVCAQIASPLGAGLFQRAISESGPCTFLSTTLQDGPAGSPESAVALGARFAHAVACDTATDVAACMRSRPFADVIAAAPTPIELTRTSARYQPNIDGWVLPEWPWLSFRNGRIAHVDTMAGTNRDEGTFFSVGAPLATSAEFQAAAEALVPGHGADVVALYPVASYPSPTAAYDAFLTDAIFVCPTRDQARYVTAVTPRMYLYHFTRLNRAGVLLGLGVYHSSELPYVFGNFVPPYTATDADTALSETMLGYWTRFAATGDPNGGSAPTWPLFTTAGDSYLELGDTVMAGTALHRARCDALEPWFNP